MEKRTAYHVSLNNLVLTLFFLTIFTFDKARAADAPDIAIAKQFFGNAKPATQCKTLSRHPSGDIKSISPEANKFVQSYLELWRKEDAKGIYELLYPSAQKSFSVYKIKALFQHMKQSYKGPLEYTALRVWGIYTKDGNPEPIDCEDENLKIFPVYGSPLQLLAWMQIRGERELGRLSTMFIYSGGTFKIATLTLQQWTFGGKDPESLMADGDKDAKEKNYVSAFVKYDLAKKLIDESGNIAYPDTVILKDKLNELKKTHDWEPLIKSKLKNYDLPRIASYYATNKGPALLVYYRLKKQTEQDVREQTCKNMGKTLSDSNLLKGLAGLRCNFLYPQHSADQEGPLKGIFYAF